MIIGIGVVNPFDNEGNENEEKEAKTCPSAAEKCCEKKCADAPKDENEAQKPDISDALFAMAEFLAEVAPAEHKPVLLAPSIGSKITDTVREILTIIMKTEGVDATCKVASIGVDAMNRSLDMLTEAVKKMRGGNKDA